MIRVGRCKYDSKGSVSYPSFPGYKNIIVMMKSHSEYYPLSPYELRNDKGQIMENMWQFSKVYEKVPNSVQRYSRWNPTVIWNHPAETHFIPSLTDPSDFSKGKILDSYKIWRKKGMDAKYPIRYPVGFNNRHKCLFSMASCGLQPSASVLQPSASVLQPSASVLQPSASVLQPSASVLQPSASSSDLSGNLSEQGKVAEDNFGKPLDYIESRKLIYVPLYTDMVSKQPLFASLKNMLQNGTNLLIIEVDGPHQESLEYYKSKYGVADDFIVDDTMLALPENLSIMMNDPKHPFGHGYCLAMALISF